MNPHAGHIEVAVANLIGYRENTIVPNVSWGLGLKHECDLLILDQKGRFTEVEIKVSKSDFLADFKKPHGHKSKVITRLIYAVPDSLSGFARQYLEENAPSRNIGLIEVYYNEYIGKWKAKWVKYCIHRKDSSKPSDSMIKQFYHLGCMRIWSLKSCIYNR